MRSGNAVQSHVETIVRVGVQGKELRLLRGAQRTERFGRAAARRNTRVASGSSTPSLNLVTLAPGGYGGGDAGGQGNGGEEREDGFVEKHFEKMYYGCGCSGLVGCVLVWVVVRNLEGHRRSFYTISSMRVGMIKNNKSLAVDETNIAEFKQRLVRIRGPAEQPLCLNF
jgi:hypothetical protein